jgi:hypothetical protein
MNDRMRSFAEGIIMGLCRRPLPDTPTDQASFVFDQGSGTLTIYKDDGSLSYSFSDESLRLTVLEV